MAFCLESCCPLLLLFKASPESDDEDEVPEGDRGECTCGWAVACSGTARTGLGIVGGLGASVGGEAGFDAGVDVASKSTNSLSAPTRNLSDLRRVFVGGGGCVRFVFLVFSLRRSSYFSQFKNSVLFGHV